MAQDSFSYDDASKPVARGFSYEDASSEPPRRTARDIANDIGVVAVKSAIGLPQSAVGLADLVTGGRAGKALEDAGVRFKDAQNFLDDQYSDAQKAANKKVAGADGFVGTAKAMLENPSTIATSVGESIPQMLGGAGVARGLLKLAPKVAPAIAGAVGEGVLGAGSQAEQIRQETQDGLLTPKQAALAAASGVTTTAFGAAGGRAAQRLGIGDAETMLAQGAVRGAGPASKRSIARQVGEGVLSEGVLEEVPQSMAEQALQNLALDKPVGEGVGAAAAQGLLAGGAMGGGAALVHGASARGEPAGTVPGAPGAPDGMALAPNEQQPAPAVPGDVLPAVEGGAASIQRTFDPRDPGSRPPLDVMPQVPTDGVPFEAEPTVARREFDTGDLALGDRQSHVPPSEAMGIDPSAGPLSTGAAIAVDSGVHGQVLQDAQRQADAATLAEQEQAAAANRAEPPVLDYSDLDERDRSLYDDYFRTLDRETEGHMAAALVDDVPDFGDRNVTDEQFLRALGANDQEIADAIQVARGAAGPEERAGGAVAPAADVPEGARPAAGAAPVQQGQAEPAQAVATAPPSPAQAPTSLQQGIARARARRAAPPVPAAVAARSLEEELGDGVGTYAQKLDVHIEDARRKLTQANSVAPTLRKVNGVDMDALSAEVSRLESRRAEAKALDDQALRSEVTRGMLKSARQELDASALTPSERVDAARRASQRGNAADASQEIFDAVDAAANEAATSPQNDRAEPTQAQKEAGNYKLGHLSGDEVQGLRISIENPQGSTRSGKSPDGKDWSNNMAAHYGYVKGSEAADGDHVDVFVGPNASTAPTVYVVDQVNADGSYDEAKALFGFNSEAEALAAYKGSYDANWKVGPVTAMSVDEFKAGLASGRFKKPLSEQLMSKPSEPVDTPATPGEYRVQTVVGRQVERQLGAASITNLADLAAATQYLYRSAVERFDAIVTDAAGKPLAVVGGFKGAVSQASVYPATIMGEAVRVPGAAHIWFSHNHPSGDATLSQADQFLERNLRDAFRGTGIEPMGLIAVGNGRWEGTDGNAGSIVPSTAQTKVPVVERELSTSNAGEALSSPDVALRTGKAYYEQAKTPGLILLDSQNRVAAWVPLSPAMQGKLRHTGQLRALYRAISESNARSAILVHQGELDAPLASRGGVTVAQNIGAALNQIDVRLLDVTNALTGRSAAQLGESMAAGPVFRRTPRDGTEALSPAVANAMQALSRPTYSPQARTQAVATVRKTVDAIRSAWGNSPDIVVAFDMNDAAVPDAARRADLRQRSGGARGAPEGFYYRGKAYLMASRLATPEDAARVLYHEVLGHHGLRGTFGKQLDGVLNQIATMRRAEVDAKVREYGLRGVNKLDRRAAAEEVLAEMAQNTPELHFVRRAVAAIRTWLRQHVPGFRGLRLTDDEIIRNFILPARAFVERSAGAAAPRAGLAFSRAEGIDPDAESRAFLDGAPVAQMTGKEFAPDGVPITEKVTQHYATTGNAQVEVPGIGLVSLDRQAVKSSLFHGIGRDKATAFAAVPDVLKNGKIIHAEAMEGARDAGMVYHVAAPVRIGDRDMVEVVLVKADSNAKRMYVHEVVLREKLRQPAVEAGAGAAGAGVQTRADAGAIRSVLDRIYSVNPAPGEPTSSGQTSTPAFRAWFGDSKVVDAQGAPLEVFHGTTAQFTAFDPSKKGTATGAKSAAGGFFFAADRSTAETYASNLFATARRARADRDRAIEMIKQLTGEENVERAQFDFFRGKFDGSGNEDAIDRAIEKRQQAEAKLENIGDDYFGPAARRAKGAQVIGAYLSIKNPLVHDQQGQISRDASFSELIAQARAEGRDGVIIRNTQDDGSRNDAEDSTTDVYIAFEPGQIKSASGNAGTFDESNPDIMFSRSTVGEYARTAAAELNKTFSAPGRLSWWHKTIGTMYNLAERSPAFKPVFDAAQGFVDDVSHYATDAAELAPKLLPKLETWRDIKKSPISAADNTAVAKPVFEGTLTWARDEQGAPVQVQTLIDAAAGLTSEQKAQRLLRNGMLDERMLKAWQGMPLESYEKAVASRYESRMLQPGVVWSDAELRSMFQLTDDQVALYREFREATNRSLDTMARADMLRFAGDDAKGLRAMVMDAPDAQAAAVLIRDHLAQLAGDQPDRATLLMNTANGIMDRADKVLDLQARGYAPLSRFGRYSVDVVDAKGERQYFGLFETARDANTMAARMRGEFGEAAVSQGTLSEEAFKMFAGVTPETLELFGNALGLDSTGDRAQDQAFQEYLKLTKTNRSAMRRLIHRKGIAGFSEDVGRVLASFIYSNARQTAAGLNMGDLGEAVNAIPKEQGELKDVAVRLAEYVKNPQEEAQAVRGLLFAQYLGGSIASAFVNMTQPAAVTFPWLSQFGGARKAAAALGAAAKNMATKGFEFEPDLAKALKTAEDEGVVAPQEVHQLMAQARGSGSLRAGDGTRLGDARASGQNALSRLSLAWGKVFGAAEQVNRRMTFIAAYRVARDRGEADPAAFASRAVRETQFVYSKASKMQWGRGAVGGTMMCVDDTTEALTSEGWKTVDELREGALIASFDMSSEKLLWKPVQMVFQKEKAGEMIHVKDRNLDMFMTPDHRVVTYREERVPGQRSKYHRRLQIQEAQNLTSKDCIPVAAPFDHQPAGEALPDALVRVIGWAVTEGHFVKKNRGREEWGGHLRIGQNEGPKAERIRQDLTAAGLPWVEHRWHYKNGNAQHICFTIKKSACAALRDLLPEKALTPALLMRMTTAQIRELVDVMVAADGHTDSRGKRCFIQNPGHTLDSFQMALTMLGVSFSVHQHGPAARKVVLKDAKWYTLSRTKGERVPFEGRVWCPIVADTYTWVARRGGRVFITHNTFKTYSIAYLELLHRMYTQGGPEGKRAALLALGMLMLMGGSGGLPFAEDAEDVADALAQLLGYNFSAKKARQEVLEAMLPKGIADFLDKGVSGLPGAPLDVSGRLGMGNLIPGTGLLQQKTSHTRDVLEIAGPAGDFASRIFSGALNVAKGNVGAGALEVAPTAVRNAAKGVDMAATGMYRDAKGYKVLETNHLEAALKAIGFQPQSVATIQEANAINQQAKGFYNLRAQEIRAEWAAGVFEKDDSKVRAARESIAGWNAKNPDQPMLIRVPDIMRRVREMQKSKDQRIADTAPRAMRAQMRQEVAAARAG